MRGYGGLMSFRGRRGIMWWCFRAMELWLDSIYYIRLLSFMGLRGGIPGAGVECCCLGCFACCGNLLFKMLRELLGCLVSEDFAWEKSKELPDRLITVSLFKLSRIFIFSVSISVLFI